jgi:hypothetical protein
VADGGAAGAAGRWGRCNSACGHQRHVSSTIAFSSRVASGVILGEQLRFSACNSRGCSLSTDRCKWFFSEYHGFMVHNNSFIYILGVLDRYRSSTHGVMS